MMLNDNSFFLDKNGDELFKHANQKYANSINGLLGDRLIASIRSDGIWIESKYTNGRFHSTSTCLNTMEIKMQMPDQGRKIHPIDFKLKVFYDDLIFKKIEPYWLLLSELNTFYPDESCTLLELSKVMSDKSLLEQKASKLKKLISKMDKEFQKYYGSSKLFASIKASALFTASHKAQLCLNGIVDKQATFLSSLIYGKKEYAQWYNITLIFRTFLQDLKKMLN